MSDDHVHIWARSGCYCGKKQCVVEGYTDVNGKFVECSLYESVKLGVKLGRCKNPSVDGELGCESHRHEKELYGGRSGVWKSPGGGLFLGPHGAWKAMKQMEAAQ
jgi:hypothetical protein